MPFFLCKNCKKKWQYPIEKCPYCFEFLERAKSTKVKVIGVSKVSIPSFFHQTVPYFVLVVEDENGNRWIQKSEKEFKVGEVFEIKKSTSEGAVAIWKTKYDHSEAIEKVTELLGGLNIKPDSKILILPTLEKETHPYFRDNLSPEFLEAVLNFLFELGMKPENIKIASQSFDEVSIGVKAKRSGLLAVAQKFKVLPIDLAQGEFIKKGDLEISTEVFQNDLILNLPILKIGRSMACENLFVILKKENLLAQKYLYSEKEMIIKLFSNLPKIFTIGEGRHIRDEKGFTHYLNLTLASFSPQNLDRVFYEVVKRELPEMIKDVKIEVIEIVGRKLNEI